MWPRRLKQGVALVPLVFLVTCAAPKRRTPEPRHHEALPRLAAPQPDIVLRSTWHADEKAVREKPVYARAVQVVFVHHTSHSNTYDCQRDVPRMLQSMEEHHINDMGWNDIGYNFVIDRCGNIYEGRAGDLNRSVRGAHTKGFNATSVGIAALGHFGAGEKPPRPMLDAMAAVIAWKLPPGVNPKGRVRMVSDSDKSRFRKGTTATLDVIAGHRDGYETECPGDAMYDALPGLRDEVARLRRR